MNAFSALTLLVRRQEEHPACKKTECWGAGMVICLERGADLHMAQLMLLPHSQSLASVKSRLVLPFWYRPTRVVSEKWPVNVCVCVCLSVIPIDSSTGSPRLGVLVPVVISRDVCLLASSGVSRAVRQRSSMCRRRRLPVSTRIHRQRLPNRYTTPT